LTAEPIAEKDIYRHESPTTQKTQMCNKSNSSAKAREMKWSRTNASLEVVQGVCGEKICQAIKYRGRERKSASSTLSLHRVVLRNQNNLPPYEGLLLLYPIYIHRQPTSDYVPSPISIQKHLKSGV